MSFSKGEWKFSKGEDNCHLSIDSTNVWWKFASVVIALQEAEDEASETVITPSKEGEANARLIVSAPKLYELLKRFTKTCPPDEDIIQLRLISNKLINFIDNGDIKEKYLPLRGEEL